MKYSNLFTCASDDHQTQGKVAIDQQHEDTMSTVFQRREKVFNRLKSEAQLQSNYSKMTDVVFKQKLTSCLAANDDSIIQWLDTPTQWTRVRQYADLLTRFYCAQYQRELWKACYSTTAMFFPWPSVSTREMMALDGSLNEFFFHTPEKLKEQDNQLFRQCNRTEQALYKFERQHERLLTDPPIDVKALVEHDLRRLRMVYEWENLLFQYDAKEYRSLALFYELTLTEEQIRATKHIWDLTASLLGAEEQLSLLLQRLNAQRSFRVPSPFQRTVWFTQSLRSLERWKNVRLVRSIKDVRLFIRKHHTRIHEAKRRLFHGQSRSTSLIWGRLSDSINRRQRIMLERTEYLLQCQTMSFTGDISLYSEQY